MKIELEVKPPQMPNFISVRQRFLTTEMRDNEDAKIPVGSMSGPEVDAYLELYAAEFRRHWERKVHDRSELERTQTEARKGRMGAV